MAALLVFITATLAKKKRTVGRKRFIWRYVFKNPATAVEYPAK